MDSKKKYNAKDVDNMTTEEIYAAWGTTEEESMGNLMEMVNKLRQEVAKETATEAEIKPKVKKTRLVIKRVWSGGLATGPVRIAAYNPKGKGGPRRKKK